MIVFYEIAEFTLRILAWCLKFESFSLKTYKISEQQINPKVLLSVTNSYDNNENICSYCRLNAFLPCIHCQVIIGNNLLGFKYSSMKILEGIYLWYEIVETYMLWVKENFVV